MAESRISTVRLVKILATYDQADTGRTLTLRDSGGAVLVTASEIGSTGLYKATWDPATTGPKIGYWYIDGVVSTTLPPEWMGLWGGPHAARIFYNITVYDSAASPTGAVGSPKSWTTGTGTLATDSDGRTDFNFVNPPIVVFNPKQTRVPVVSGLVTVSGGKASFSTTVTDSGDLYDSTTCRADIIIIPRD